MTQPNTAALSNLMDRIDRVTHPVVREQPPTYGENHRQAIHSCIGALSTDICARIQQLREMLDAIDKSLLQSAEKSRNTLDEHVALSSRIDDEIKHMTGVITELAEQARGTQS